MNFSELNLYKAKLYVTYRANSFTLDAYIAITGDTAQAASVIRPRVSFDKFEIRSIESVGKVVVGS